ncbi:MAG: hypothetical protein IPL47_14425 [Phyllobacteriaceae bacterium]|nr:hypothetical protein [Phyllobacteriaceae bacterium]
MSAPDDRSEQDRAGRARAGVRQFALLAALEATSRSVLISVYPILMYRSLGDAKTVSEVYFAIGVTALAAALMTPWIGRFVPRRFLYTGAGALMFAASMVGLFGGLAFIPFAVAMNAVALVVLTINLSAYLMDFIERTAMGRNEAMRLVYSGLPWSVGPYLGVWLMDRHPTAPFLLSAAAGAAQMAWFWYLRLGDGKGHRLGDETAGQPVRLPAALLSPAPAGRRVDICRDAIGRLGDLHDLPADFRR